MDDKTNAPPESDPRHDEGLHYRTDPSLILDGIQGGSGVVAAGAALYAAIKAHGESDPPPSQDSWTEGPVSPPAVDADSD